MDNKIAHGTIIDPVDNVTSSHFHCLPLLTRPKDLNKCRVILNLNYPYGNSLNDKVNKCQFDGIKLVLRYPSVDDIVAKILDTQGELYLNKIDVSRAFRNLWVDPAKTLKFGIYWQGKYFIDNVIAFSWVHGSSVFQMMSNAITCIIGTKNHHIWAYIDDYFLVDSEELTAFHDLYSVNGIRPFMISTLLTELGLPMNSENGTPHQGSNMPRHSH